MATAIVLIALTAIGMLETRFNIKMFSLVYEVRGDDSNAIEGAVLNALDSQGKRLFDPERDTDRPDSTHQLFRPRHPRPAQGADGDPP